MDIGTKIKELRKKHNLKQEELALKAGVSTGTIGLYERGKKYPTIEITVKIANAMGLTVSEFFDEQVDLSEQSKNNKIIIGQIEDSLLGLLELIEKIK